jgi:hypothetical protein
MKMQLFSYRACFMVFVLSGCTVDVDLGVRATHDAGDLSPAASSGSADPSVTDPSTTDPAVTDSSTTDPSVTATSDDIDKIKQKCKDSSDCSIAIDGSP